ISALAIERYSRSEHPLAQPSHWLFLPKSRAHASAPAHTILPLRVLTPSLIRSAPFIRSASFLSRRFAANNRQCAYICSLDFCILRELLARQSRWPVQCCRIQNRHAVNDAQILIAGVVLLP